MRSIDTQNSKARMLNLTYQKYFSFVSKLLLLYLYFLVGCAVVPSDSFYSLFVCS